MSYDTRSGTIRIGPTTDVLAEIGVHSTLVLRKLAHEPSAPEQLRADWSTLENWLGCVGRDVSDADVARITAAWQAYFARGIAPSDDLQAVFAFRHGDGGIGQSLASISPPEAIFDVFDRLLATGADLAKRKPVGIAANLPVARGRHANRSVGREDRGVRPIARSKPRAARRPIGALWLLVGLLVAVFIFGGLVGGEIAGRSFSWLGAVIGGVGTGGMLLALGAFFTAVEERKRKEALPPEMRRVFDQMFGSPEQARSLLKGKPMWKPRPFHSNKSKEDHAEWFAHAPEWSRVDPRLMACLIDRLHGNPMFEVFVHASRECKVIGKYETLGALFDKGIGDVAAPPRVADILCNAGVQNGGRFAELLKTGAIGTPESGRYYENAMNACEAAVHVEPEYLPAYLHLAVLRAMLNKTEDSRTWATRGLAVLQRMRGEPYHLSSIPSIKNAEAGLDEMERKLRSLMADL